MAEHSAGADRFFEEFHAGRYIDYQLFELQELAALSHVVLIGDMVDFSEGGTVGGFASIVAEVKVERVVKGSAKDSVFVELLLAPASRVSDLRRAFAPFNGLWLLQDARFALEPSPLDQDRGRGVPAGEQLLAPSSDQCLIIDGRHGLHQPLQLDPAGWFAELDNFQSLNDVADALQP